ncbi:winged helix-turn-helix domain-containing protein [Chromobacterium amazonense]|uniref:winged helix-turn-helix domain-containing protein n=1 Tax=Chromobacterium amazonense TaxID=1382803 RepID=UPI00237E78A5|nr:winged helix-turn-helix domain-containing protein [Chromobacterium amazonense]
MGESLRHIGGVHLIRQLGGIERFLIDHHLAPARYDAVILRHKQHYLKDHIHEFDGTTLNREWLCSYLKSSLQRGHGENLSRQLYRHLRELIRQTRLAPGSAVPASRQLAETLALGRNTVLAAYEQLIAEGYLESKHGSGTYVCQAFASTASPAAAA